MTMISRDYSNSSYPFNHEEVELLMAKQMLIDKQNKEIK